MWLGSQRELASDSCVVWGWLRVPEVPLRERGGKGGDPSCLRVPSVSHGVGGDPGMSPPKSEGDGSGPWGGGKEGWGVFGAASVSPLCPMGLGEARGWGRGGDGGSSELPPCPLHVPSVSPGAGGGPGMSPPQLKVVNQSSGVGGRRNGGSLELPPCPLGLGETQECPPLERRWWVGALGLGRAGMRGARSCFHVPFLSPGAWGDPGMWVKVGRGWAGCR